MAKKAVKGETIAEISISQPLVAAISPITTDFGREDLNQLRDKLNELIARG